MTVLSGNIAEEVPTVEVAEAMVDNVPMLSGHVDVVDTLAAGDFFIELRRDFFITITTFCCCAAGKKGASKLATLPTLIDFEFLTKDFHPIGCTSAIKCLCSTAK